MHISSQHGGIMVWNHVNGMSERITSGPPHRKYANFCSTELHMLLDC